MYPHETTAGLQLLVRNFAIIHSFNLVVDAMPGIFWKVAFCNAVLLKRIAVDAFYVLFF